MPHTRKGFPRAALALAAALVLAAALISVAGCRRAPAGSATSPAAAVGSAAPTSTSPEWIATETPLAQAETSESAPAYSSASTETNAASPALDAFIAEQYPGYSVVRRIAVPGQVDPGRLSVNYLLVDSAEKRFTLLVSVAQLSAAETADDAQLSHYVDLVGRVLTNDDTFPRDAAQRYSALSAQGQNAIINAYVAQKPTPGAIAHDAQFDPETGADMGVESGPGALGRAMQNFGSAGDWEAKSSVPSGPQNSVATVTLEQLPTE